MFFLDVVLFVGFVGKNNMMLYFCSVLYMGSIIDFVLLTHKQQTKTHNCHKDRSQVS